ncbi:primosomal protein DnaI, partial [Enterococcus faecalis]
NLGDFVPACHGRAKALAEAMQFLREYAATPKEFHNGLYLQGPFGVGKSFLLGPMANALAERRSTTTIVHFRTFTVK